MSTETNIELNWWERHDVVLWSVLFAVIILEIIAIISKEYWIALMGGLLLIGWMYYKDYKSGNINK
ncbi:MAG: hypothetical protein ABII75_09135 [Candidatus Omnitrophota bacterium]